jgi:hypothetical protein
VLFRSLNHIVGEARCHQQLAQIARSQDDHAAMLEHDNRATNLKNQFRIYYNKYKKRCIHIQRCYVQDISLMTEIVNDNENRDLFPELSSKHLQKRELST